MTDQPKQTYTDYLTESFDRSSAPRVYKEIERMVSRFESDVERMGSVVRWKRTNTVPHDSVLDLWVHVGKLSPEVARHSKSQARIDIEAFKRHEATLLGAGRAIRTGRELQNFLDPQYIFFFSESERCLENFYTDASVEEGVVRWTNVGRVPPAELLQLWAFCNCPFDYSKSVVTLDHDTQVFLKDARERDKGREVTGEELSELRANFEPGTTVVDVITGRKIKL